jgi:hypothetical protein
MDDERTPDEQADEQPGEGSTGDVNADVALGRTPNGDDAADDETPASDDG